MRINFRDKLQGAGLRRIKSQQSSYRVRESGDRSMARLIEVLREEHRNIEKLLGVLEQELGVFDRRERPDYETLQAIVDYFEEYPARCHHPKEDMIVAILKARNPSAAGSLEDIELDHRQEDARLRRLAHTLENVRTGGELPRQSVDDIVREFIAHERRHIDYEEHALFPAAVKALTTEDWAGIDARMSNARDPLFDRTVEEKFGALAQKILQWEQENEDDRRSTAVAAKA
jgi:hemerythrin-like domain-containing protein